MNAHASELKDRIERKKERQDKLAKLGKTASGFMAQRCFWEDWLA